MTWLCWATVPSTLQMLWLLHWLHVQEQIVFKVAVLTSSITWQRATLFDVAVYSCRWCVRLRSSSTNSSSRHATCLQLERGSSRLRVPASGTVCRWIWPLLRHCLCLDSVWRQFCSAAAIIAYMSSELSFFPLTVVLAVFSILRPL